MVRPAGGRYDAEHAGKTPIRTHALRDGVDAGYSRGVGPGEGEPVEYDGRILVPFPVESALSGVMRPVGAESRLWYRRTFARPNVAVGRTLLHFGAVDWHAVVWVNGQRLGEHKGGYDPFTVHDWVAEKKGRWAEGVQAYLASISFADAMVGRLLDALDESGRADQTIIVLWSDHGWHLGEKQRWRKSTLWEETTRVPLLVVAPGVTRPGSRTAAPVSLMDLYPTLKALAGLRVPGHAEGTSLVPLLEDPDASWEHAAVSTFGFRNHAVRDHRYRYIKYADGSEELYDHERDPHEWENLASSDDMRDVKKRLASWLPRRNAPRARSR